MARRPDNDAPLGAVTPLLPSAPDLDKPGQAAGLAAWQRQQEMVYHYRRGCDIGWIAEEFEVARIDVADELTAAGVYSGSRWDVLNGPVGRPTLLRAADHPKARARARARARDLERTRGRIGAAAAAADARRGRP